MNATAAWMMLAALDRAGKLSAMRQGFERSATEDNTTAIGVLLIAVGLCGLLGILSQILQRRQTGRSVDYLGRTARVVGLSRRELRMLRKVAKAARLRQPAAMLLSPANLAHGVALALPPQGKPRLRQRMDGICRRIFGQPLPAPAVGPRTA